MKVVAAIFAALAGAVAVSAAPHSQERDDTPYRTFKVTNFSAAAVVLSHRVSYVHYDILKMVLFIFLTLRRLGT
jgi:hypothetical protein